MNSLSRRVFARSVFETFRKRARLGGFLGEARGSRLRLETRRLRAALGAFQTETCIRQRVGSVIVYRVSTCSVSSVSGSVRSVMSVSSSFVSREFAPCGVALRTRARLGIGGARKRSSDRARASSARAVSARARVALGARHPHLLRRGQKCVLRVQQLPLRLVRRADEVAAAASAAGPPTRRKNASSTRGPRAGAPASARDRRSRTSPRRGRPPRGGRHRESRGDFRDRRRASPARAPQTSRGGPPLCAWACATRPSSARVVVGTLDQLLFAPRGTTRRRRRLPGRASGSGLEVGGSKDRWWRAGAVARPTRIGAAARVL